MEIEGTLLNRSNETNEPNEQNEQNESSEENEENTFNNNDEECSVCLSKLDNNSYTTDCFHVFCKNCLEGWFDSNHNTCPLCRSRIKECNHNSENTQIKIYFGNNNSDSDNQILNLRRENSSLKKILKRYNYSLCFFFALFVWNKWSYYSVIHNYQVLSDQCSELQNTLNTLNNSYMKCLDKEECIYNVEEIKDNIPVTLYSHQTLLGICLIPVNYLYSCILNN